MIINNNQKGFTLLLASLIAALLLSVGLSMFSLAQKQIILSGLGRDSQFAFYAADSGAECALYWDFKGAFNILTPMEGAKCGNQFIGKSRPPQSGLWLGGELETDFWFEQVLPDGSKRCINVTVTKFLSGSASTEINSRGYSVRCDASGRPIQTPRTLERAVRMRY